MSIATYAFTYIDVKHFDDSESVCSMWMISFDLDALGDMTLFIHLLSSMSLVCVDLYFFLSFFLSFFFLLFFACLESLLSKSCGVKDSEGMLT